MINTKPIENKIRKRIKTRELIEGKAIDEIQITKKEAEQLENTIEIDNVKLVIVDKLGDKSKKNCFAYIERKGHRSCYCLNNLYCQNRKCNFYRTDINISSIEKDIKKYAEGRWEVY